MDNINTKAFNVCRTCMRRIVDISSCSLLDSTKVTAEITLGQKLRSCIPELDLSVTSNTVLCTECADTVNSMYKFKNTCLQSEVQIHKYIQQRQNADDIHLMDVTQFHQLHNSNLSSTEFKPEKEVIEVFKNEDLRTLVCDDILNEAGTSTESIEEYFFLSEKIEPEYVTFNMDKNSINCIEGISYMYDTSSIVENHHIQVIDNQDSYIRSVIKTDIYQCCTCGYKTKNNLNLISHLKNYKGKMLDHKKLASKRLIKSRKILCRYYKCSFCNYVTKYKCSWNLHTSLHLTKMDYNRVYKYRCIRRTVLVNTNKMNNKDKAKPKFSETNYLKPDQVKKRFKCSLCEHSCDRKSRLERHMRTHTKEKPFKCILCEHHSNSKENLKLHMRIHTGEKPFMCSVCGYRCNTNSCFRIHMRIHTGEKPYKCSICEYCCNNGRSLKIHMRTHTGEKPYPCSVCEHRFNQKVHLRRHMLIHSGNKQFECVICEKRFLLNSHLREHMKIHTGEKPFHCSVCVYRCRKKNDLMRHMQIHADKKSLKCSYCDYKAKRKDYLQRHMKIHSHINTEIFSV